MCGPLQPFACPPATRRAAPVLQRLQRLRRRVRCAVAALLALALCVPAVAAQSTATAAHPEAAAVPAASASPPRAVVVGSKRFTESYILGEIVRQALQRAGVPAVHRQGLGNTAVMDQALAARAIDLYPEYTGTIVRELLHRQEAAPPLAQLNQWLAPRGLRAGVPLGFNNSYALAMREDTAQRLGIATLSDLARSRAPLRLGLSHEFLQRADGWPALRQAYGLPQVPGSGLDHGLAYQALAGGQVDVVDAYTTDAQVARLHLRLLTDDRHFFPRYDAVLLMQAGFDDRPLAPLAGRIDDAAMRAMNAQVELDGRSFEAVARDFLERGAAGPAGTAAGGGPGAGASSTAGAGPSAAAPSPPGFWQRLLAPDLPRLLREHLLLAGGALVLAAIVGVPLGILAQRRPRVGAVVAALVGMAQTVPSLALLVFFIALLGRIGFWPALLALAVYALLPVVRNTQAGLQGVPAGLRESGAALGFTPAQRLRLVELPLALPVIVAGLNTAAVWSVGMATVATLIGAGGLGERIVAGLAVNDAALMLSGAVPAALLALAVQGAFALVERVLGPRR